MVLNRKLFQLAQILIPLTLSSGAQAAIAPPSAMSADAPLRIYKSVSQAGLLLKMMALSATPSERKFFDEKIRLIGMQRLPQIMKEEVGGKPRLRLPDYDFTVQALPKDNSVEIQINGKTWTPPQPLTAKAVWDSLEKEVASKSDSTPFDVIHSIFAPDGQALASLIGTVGAYASVSFAVQSTCKSVAVSANEALQAICTPVWAWPMMAWNWSQARADSARTVMGTTDRMYCYIEKDTPDAKVFLISPGFGPISKTTVTRKGRKTIVVADTETTKGYEPDNLETHTFVDGKWESTISTLRGKLMLDPNERTTLERWVKEDTWKSLCTAVPSGNLAIEAAIIQCRDVSTAIPVFPAAREMEGWLHDVKGKLENKLFSADFGMENPLSRVCQAGPCLERSKALHSCLQSLAQQIGEKAYQANARVSLKGYPTVKESKSLWKELLSAEGWFEPDQMEVSARSAR